MKRPATSTAASAYKSPTTPTRRPHPHRPAPDPARLDPPPARPPARRRLPADPASAARQFADNLAHGTEPQHTNGPSHPTSASRHARADHDADDSAPPSRYSGIPGACQPRRQPPYWSLCRYGSGRSRSWRVGRRSATAPRAIPTRQRRTERPHHRSRRTDTARCPRRNDHRQHRGATLHGRCLQVSPTSTQNSRHQRTTCSWSCSPATRPRPSGRGCGGVSVPRRRWWRATHAPACRRRETERAGPPLASEYWQRPGDSRCGRRRRRLWLPEGLVA